MLKRCPIRSMITRNYSGCTPEKIKVLVYGGTGGVGQPLSLLLKLNKCIHELAIYSPKDSKGFALDLSHIETDPIVRGYTEENVECAFKGANIVIFNAGAPGKQNQTREAMFGANVEIIKGCIKHIVCLCPETLLTIITNPVNSLVPVACELLNKAKVLDPRKVFGMCTLDISRANCFVAELKGVSVETMNIPVVGGHSDKTMVPLFSRANVCLSEAETKELTQRVRSAGMEVMKAKGNTWATVSTAYSGARFVHSLIKGLKGVPNVVECAYVMSECTSAPYFSTPLLLGKCGIEQNLGIGEVNEYEQYLIDKVLTDLKKEINVGIDYVNKGDDKTCKTK